MSDLESYTTFNKGKDFAYAKTKHWTRQRKRKYQKGMLLSLDLTTRDKLQLLGKAVASLIKGCNLILRIPSKNIDYIRRV